MIKKRPKTAREAAAFTLFSVREEGAWSEAALQHYLARAALDPRDAAFAARLAYGTIQNDLYCDFFINRYSTVRLSKILPRVHECLRLGVYQLVLLDRVPSHAAVSETVELVRHYAHADERAVGFVNGVLRAVARAAEDGSLPVLDCPTKADYFSVRYSHPLWLTKQLCEVYGEKLAGQICRANNEIAPLSLRVNTLKTTRQDAIAALSDEGFTPRAHDKLENIILCEGGDIAASEAFQSGCVTVQDGASAVCADVLAPEAGQTVVDCCAAPGGKSFALADCMKNNGKIIACDIYPQKLDKIEQGANRLGITILEPRLADGTRRQGNLVGVADRVLCDVPCSGLGILRKKPEIRRKAEEKLRELPAVQLTILENCAAYAKMGGVLVYSTCTILPRENEEVVRAFLARHPEWEAFPFTHPICGERTDGTVTLLPPIHDTDGFFIARMRKKL